MGEAFVTPANVSLVHCNALGAPGMSVAWSGGRNKKK